MGTKKTHEEYVAELAVKNPNVIVLEQYIGANTKILHRCIKDNYEWKTSPHSLLNGNGCPKCSNRVHRTHDEYVVDLSNVNKNIEVIEEFVGVNKPILHRCLKCSYEWKAKPSQVLLGTGCPRCAGILKKSHEEYVCEVLLINSDIDVIGTYVDAKTPILHRCNIDGYEWHVRPDNILNGKGCPECANQNRHAAMRMTHSEYVTKVSEINQNIVVIGIYVNARTPILHRCKIDGHEWSTTPDHILRGQGCPKCNASKGENTIRQWLIEHNVKFDSQKRFNDCCDKNPLPFDFYLPDYNYCIEYDGVQHFEPIDYFGGQEAFERTVEHDNMKNEYCKNNGIELLRIPYFKNVEEELNNFLFI